MRACMPLAHHNSREWRRRNSEDEGEGNQRGDALTSLCGSCCRCAFLLTIKSVGPVVLLCFPLLDNLVCSFGIDHHQRLHLSEHVDLREYSSWSSRLDRRCVTYYPALLYRIVRVFARPHVTRVHPLTHNLPLLHTPICIHTRTGRGDSSRLLSIRVKGFYLG